MKKITKKKELKGKLNAKREENINNGEGTRKRTELC